ncbi:MAG: P-loop NTPase [Pseudomonadota bacterium]
MTTFDEIIPILVEIFHDHPDEISMLRPVLINRDLNSRVRLIVDKKLEDDGPAQTALEKITRLMQERLGPHAYEAERAVLFAPDIHRELELEKKIRLEDAEDVYVVDRLAVEGSWTSISQPGPGAPRIVFFSIKGGVGRSTALAASAWALAENGARVLVLDVDLESPGLSSSLLPEDRRPKYGITDWLVEDLVNNGDAVFEDLAATSALSHNGEIIVVPAHGADPGEYVAKLGRVWMPKVDLQGAREGWSRRLARLLDALEKKWTPDVILIDSRAGIDEVASACVTDLSAYTVLLFAVDGDQTWSGYRILFRHWRESGVVREIRNRIQVVGGMVPETETNKYLDSLLEGAWNVFSEELYDEVPSGAVATEDEYWSFDLVDEGGPHFPWTVMWNRSFAGLKSLHWRLTDIDVGTVRLVFGPLIGGLKPLLEREQIHQ